MAAMETTTVRYEVEPALRAKLHRAISAWTRDAAKADDLVQETLVEAWRSNRKPDDPEEWTAWTFGIARHVLLRDRRAGAVHRLRVADAPESAAQLQSLGTPSDVDVELTDREVRTFLDEALRHLPVATRRALLLRYVDDLNQQEAAGQIGISESALEGRLHRGKQRIQHYLIQERPQEAMSLGLIRSARGWIQTGAWCRFCGKQRLVARWTDDGDLWVDCPSCDVPPMNGARSQVIRTFDAVQGFHGTLGTPGSTSFESVFARIAEIIIRNTREGLSTSAPCPHCHGVVRTGVVDKSEKAPDLRMQCTTCRFIVGWSWSVSSCAAHPLVQQWMGQQQRTRVDGGGYLATVNGRPAVGIRYHSVGSASTVAAWRDRETMKFLQVERDGIVLPLDQLT